MYAIRFKVYNTTINHLTIGGKGCPPSMEMEEKDTFSQYYPVGHLGSEKTLFNVKYATSLVVKPCR